MSERLVKLHEYPEFLSSVVKLLNNEWPRSETARLRCLTDSRDELPCCLLLITQDKQEKIAVIGQSKLTKVHGRLESVYIENVVVEKAKRGQGHGRKLMNLSEDYALELGYKTIHLSTHDKCQFYEHLGYQYSSAVTPVRANAKLLTPEQFSALQSHLGEKFNEDNKPLPNTGQDTYDIANCKENANKLSFLKQHQGINSLYEVTEDIEWSTAGKNETEQRKEPLSLPNIAVPLAPIPPPPVPPPLTNTASNKGKQHLYWMVKTLS